MIQNKEDIINKRFKEVARRITIASTVSIDTFRNACNAMSKSGVTAKQANDNLSRKK